MKAMIIPFSILMLFILTENLFSKSENDGLSAWWKFETLGNNSVAESVHNSSCRINGFQKLTNGADGNGLLLDGYTTYVENDKNNLVEPAGGFTAEAWIAFQAYPWNWVGIVDKQVDQNAGYNLSVDAKGYLRFQVAVDGKLHTAKSSDRIELLEWAHIAGSFDPEKGIEIYINGEPAGFTAVTGKYTPPENVSLWIGRSHIKRAPVDFIRMDLPASYSFDGIIDEVMIYNNVQDAGAIADYYNDSKPQEKYALEYRKMPAGPEGPGRFGAYYTHLEFSETWDYPWRVGPYSDVLVRFDEAGYKFVFWRGTSYIPCWVTENGIWYTNEFNETWGDDVMGCAEPMSDKQTRQSHVRIIESNDARVVVHWRYALVDNRGIIAKTDPVSGWGDWSDEYYVIYPDGIGTRKINLWSSEPTKPHQFQEAIILNPPGTRPEDNINVDAITMMNMKGETHTYSWKNGAPEEIDKPDNYNIEFINLKSKSIPFVVVNEGKPSVVRRNIETDGPWLKIYRGEIREEYSMFPWWNHWPVAQIPSDGRWASEPDRVSHTSLSNDLEWKETELTDRTLVRVMMHGLTDKPKQEIVDVAKSWLYPPDVKVNDGFKFKTYDDYERAFMLEKTGTTADELDMDINASPESPLYNPAFVIKNWGDSGAALQINGKSISRGKNFRYGLRHTLEGSDLIVWLDYKTDKNTSIQLSKINLSSK